ncbi:unnamed protein product [Rotaria magnacalcarata]|uniref:U-box domain-containing protein n=2 Tax=Rotaria magnacalcarata TaxID=392030 RepID=A0A819K1H1_9BILA|nr:unnamed protein product [Rotaria magnacalcarata]CAF1392356.1 unnamed protein product [Rotaria magnacalcarata]CAF2086251.1 unnamed protein product [Rotaria magnacalcarata]CAF3832312.1 unnamed protein product [Rotaria magnacalcarata]CAF3926162.1 unnamed protein product [Rotaria magnacalcarata]
MPDPVGLCCPITQELFVDPVIAEDGQTYERAAIVRWLQNGNQTSPISRAYITIAGLRPVFAIKQQVEEYKNRQNASKNVVAGRSTIEIDQAQKSSVFDLPNPNNFNGAEVKLPYCTDDHAVGAVQGPMYTQAHRQTRLHRETDALLQTPTPRGIQDHRICTSNTRPIHVPQRSYQCRSNCCETQKRCVLCCMFITAVLLCAIVGGILNAKQKSAHKRALLLSDDQSALLQPLINRLQDSGITTTYVQNGTATYSGLPDARVFDVVILITGDLKENDMPISGQLAIVNAQQFNGTGVVMTEWAAYHVSKNRWQTLSQLLLSKQTMNGFTNTLTFSLILNNHPIWTGLPKTFITAIQMDVSRLGVPVNGASILANCTECASKKIGVVVRPRVGVDGRIVQIAHAGHSGGNRVWAVDDNITTMMVNAVRWAAKLI